MALPALLLLAASSAYQQLPCLRVAHSARRTSTITAAIDAKRGSATLGFAGGAFAGRLLWNELLAQDLVEPVTLSCLVGVECEEGAPSALLPEQAPPLTLPSFQLPDAPSFGAPSFSLPELPSLQLPELPSFNLPFMSMVDEPSNALRDVESQLTSVASSVRHSLVPPAYADDAPPFDLSALASSLQLPSDLPALVDLSDSLGLSAAFGIVNDYLDAFFDLIAEGVLSIADLIQEAALSIAGLLPGGVDALNEFAISSSAVAQVYVGELTGDVLLPLASGLLGALLLAVLSEGEGVIGYGVRFFGAIVDGLIFGLFFPAIGFVINGAISAVVGSVLGAVYGPGMLVTAVPEKAAKKKAAEKAKARKARGGD